MGDGEPWDGLGHTTAAPASLTAQKQPTAAPGIHAINLFRCLSILSI